MRKELENVKLSIQKAASSARPYHENIAHVRRTCRPEVVLKESEAYSKPLKEAMEKATEEIKAQFADLTASIKKKSILDPAKYNQAYADLIWKMKPDAEELEAIAKMFDGNETMLRVFHQYKDENKIIANLPLCGADRLKHVKQMQDDLTYILGLAGEPLSATNRYADAQLQHFAEHFEKCFSDRIEAIGDF